jgi:hypothetical protein
MTKHVTTVRHQSSRHVIIAPADGWEVTIFNIADGKFIDALVTDGDETIKVSLEGPDESTGVVVRHDSVTNETHVKYVVKRPNVEV